jgi:hypothetical protein
MFGDGTIQGTGKCFSSLAALFNQQPAIRCEEKNRHPSMPQTRVTPDLTPDGFVILVDDVKILFCHSGFF